MSKLQGELDVANAEIAELKSKNESLSEAVRFFFVKYEHAGVDGRHIISQLFGEKGLNKFKEAIAKATDHNDGEA